MLPEIGSVMDRSPAAVGLERITDKNLKAVCKLKVAGARRECRSSTNSNTPRTRSPAIPSNDTDDDEE
jgi:hypothetical protein